MTLTICGSSLATIKAQAISGGAITVKKISKNVVRVSIANLSSDISEVKFPTWTDENDQDDLIWYTKKKTNTTMSVDIDISNHKNGKGLYHTHVYASNSSGHQEGIGLTSYTFNPTLNLSASTTSWTKDNVTITATASDISGVTKITLPNGSVVTSNKATYTVTSNGTYTFKVDDGFGNVVSKSITVGNIDKSVNSIGTISSSMTRTNETTRAFTASFNAVTDSQSGIKGYSYVIDKSSSTTPDNTVDTTLTRINRNFSESETGLYYLHVKAIDNAGNASSVQHYKIDTATLTTTPQPTSNSIKLSWTLNDTSNKTYKVYQKKEGSSTYQSVSTVDFSKIKEVKVLNVYPGTGNNLKTWMETDGYGKGIIKVTPVDIDSFNSNPSSYLKNSDGTWKYDVIMFGSWDANNSKDLSSTGAKLIKSFLDSGRGVLFGHDTIYYGNPNFNELVSYANIKISGNSTYNGIESLNGYGTPPATGTSNIKVTRKGLLTNYPWVIGKVGTTLSVPSTHNTQLSNGDIWMRFSCSSYTSADLSSTSNFYLSTWHNTAMIQTGHSKGNATNDEKKLLANTLFYLKQLSTDTYLDDKSGQDLKAPNKISTINSISYSNGKMNFSFTAPTDNGSKYSYYVEAIDKDNNSTISPIKTTTIISGIKGYSYVVDKSATTEPDNTIDSTSNNISVNNITGSNNVYIHIKAIDYAGNVSETLHYKVVDSVAPTITLTPSTTNWTNKNVSITVRATDNETGVKSITLPNGSVVNGSSTTYTVTGNGTYTFKCVDYAGNTTTKSITISNIDKTVPGISVDGNLSSWTNSDVVVTITGSDTSSGVKSITLPDGSVYSGSKTTYTIKNNGNYTFKVTDNAGNVTSKTVSVTKIDSGVPTINITGNPTSWVQKATLTITGSDNQSGVKSITLPNGSVVNGSSATYTVTTNGNYTFKVTDNVGNVTTQTISVTKVDSVVPTISVTGNPTSWVQKATLTITGSDTLSGVKSITLPNGSVVNGSSTTYTVTSNGNYTFKVTDNVGNVTSQTVNVTKVDNGAPTINITGNPTSWVKSATLTITGSDTLSGVKSITLPNGSVVNSSSTQYTVTGNGNYTFKITDNAGNVTSKTVSVTKIDNGVPTINITGNPTSWVKSATLTITGSDNQSGVKSITLPNGSVVNGNSATYTVTTNGNYTFKVTDNVGNVTSQTISVTKVDSVMPTISVTGNPTSWVKSATLTITGSDTISGVKSITLPNGSVVNGTSTTYTVTSNGNYTFKVTDNAGNITTQTVNVTKVDSVVPTISITGNPTSWVQKATLTITGTDTISGVKSITLPNGSVVNGSSTTYTVTANGDYTFKVTDNAGNVTAQTVSVTKIDTNAPVVNITQSASNWTNENVKITITSTDDKSGISKIEYKLTGATSKDWTTYSEAFYITNEGVTTITARSYDKAGNISNEKTSVVKIDKTRPINGSVKIELK